MRHVADVVDTYFREQHRDDDLLTDYVGRAGNRVVFKRLGYLVETLGVDAPELLHTCEKSVSSGVTRLDPSLPNEGSVAWRWNLRINGTILAERMAS